MRWQPFSSKNHVAKKYSLCMHLSMYFWSAFGALLVHVRVPLKHLGHIFTVKNKTVAPMVPPKAPKQPYPKIEQHDWSLFGSNCLQICVFYVKLSIVCIYCVRALFLHCFWCPGSRWKPENIGKPVYDHRNISFPEIVQKGSKELL